MATPKPVALERELPGMPGLRITGRRAGECAECNGLGYTEETRSQTRLTEDRKFVTMAQGSGCPACGGTGQSP